MKLVTLFRLLYKKFFSKQESNYASFVLAEKITSLWYPKFTVSEHGKIWLEDKDFFDFYEKYVGKSYRSADRKFFIRSLLSLVDELPGDTAECGVFNGASSWLICSKFKNTNKVHHAFDSFEGLSLPLDIDGVYWQAGDLKSREDIAKINLGEYKDQIKIYKGWIPETFKNVSSEKFCFVHIDVDLYQPTFDSLCFFYPKMVTGGLILCDDYGFTTCPGAKKAFDEFMEDKAEKIINVPTGQAFVIKK